MFVKVRGSVAPPGGPIRCPEVVKRLDYEGELAIVIGAGGSDRWLLRRRRCQCPRPSAPRAAVDARQGGRHVLPVRTVGDDRRRGPGPRQPATADLGQRRPAPGQQHLGPDLRLSRSWSTFISADVHAAAGRPDPDRHAQRRRDGDGSAAVPAARATSIRIEIERLGSIEHRVDKLIKRVDR